MASCPDCGIDEADIAVPDAIAAIRTFPRRYREALAVVPPAALRIRPDPDTWSVLEYAVHAREVLELLSMTLPIVLEHPDTHFPPIDVTEAADARPDWVLDPDLVLAGIQQASGRARDPGREMPTAAWDRTVHRSATAPTRRHGSFRTPPTKAPITCATSTRQSRARAAGGPTTDSPSRSRRRRQ